MSWDVLPRKRSPVVDDRPPREGGAVTHSNSVSVFVQLSHLLYTWREDPDRLAVALAAWTLAGYSDWSAIGEVASLGWRDGDGYHASIKDDAARDLIEKALHRRNRRVLRARGEGLLLGLEALAQDADEALLHRVRVAACVVECRVLGIDERIACLRAKDTEERTPSGS